MSIRQNAMLKTLREAGKLQKSWKSSKARLYATARGVYDVTINGRRVEDFILAPGSTDYRKRIQVQTYDVTEYIREDNTIELRLADGWFRGSLIMIAFGVLVFANPFATQATLVRLAGVALIYNAVSGLIIRLKA